MNYGEGLKVLLVDQNSVSLMYMSRVLEEHSYRVTTSKSGWIALSMILERRIEFDLVITDVEMPDMDGFEFLNHITTRTDIPILLISSSDEVEVTKKALQDGACFFFHKPIAPHNLVNVWQHVLRYRLERSQVARGINPREVEKFYEALHGKPKSGLFRHSASVVPTQVSIENQNDLGLGVGLGVGLGGASSTLTKIGGNTDPSRVRTGNQSNSRNENNNGRNDQLGKRRREEDGKVTSRSSASSSSSGKKKERQQKDKGVRLYWSEELQQKFTEAFEALGETRATPSRLRELINESGITPQHISSYLQKFRAKLKNKNQDATRSRMPANVPSPIQMAQRYLQGLPSSMNPYGAPPQHSGNLNNSMPSYGHIQPGNLVPNASLYNFMGNDNLRPSVQGNTFPGLLPLGSMPTAYGIDNWQQNVEASNMLYDFGSGRLLTGQNPQVLQEMNNGLGMAGGNIGAPQLVPGANGFAQVQGQNGSLGMDGNNIDMSQLTDDDIKKIMEGYAEDDSRMGATSSGGSGSASSVVQPLTPCVGADFVNDDIEEFLALLEVPPNSDDSFLTL